MVYLPWLVIRLIPLWLGPIIGWLTQKTGARPVFEPFTPGRHVVPEDVAASFRQICDGLTTECCAAAVRALEQLAGGKATPLVGIDSVGDSVVTERFAVRVPPARAERVVAAAQPRFLEKGFYLFRSGQHFGMAGHPDHPFVLTGMGFDWVEGRFRSAIGDADALARRFYAFCPDIVERGTETVAALARELSESQRLYCWWD